MEIKTQRLTLRQIVAEDAEDIFEYCKNPNVGTNAGWKPHESLEESVEIMQAVFIGQPAVFGITVGESDKVIGSVGLLGDPKRENKHAMMLGYAMSEDYWGKGYMTEASKAVLKYGFEEMGLDMITCCCYPYNSRSRSVIKKCGFVYEGILRGQEERFDGEIMDCESYSLLKSEYEAGKE